MALSAFKSTSKRGNQNRPPPSKPASSLKDHPPENPGKKLPVRRSRSVSAVSRSSDVSQFSNTRDNPLYCCSSSSSPDSENPGGGVSGAGGRRGRSVSRGPGSSDQSSGVWSSGRNLYRMDTRRRLRSVSREHYGVSESEDERGYRLASSLRNEGVGSFAPDGESKADAVTGKSDDLGETRTLRKWTDQHPVSETWDTSSARNWEDIVSTSSFSEAEEMTIRPVCDQMKPFLSDHPIADGRADRLYETVRSEVFRAVSETHNDRENVIRRINSAFITTDNTVDKPSEFVNADAIELVSNVRRDYATKLEQSQELARKLRADLAVEEQRAQELSRILDLVPDPKSSNTSRSHPKRKASIERLKMSRRLAEEAMNYFDECVSISTFDSSDFSSLEDPQPSSDVAIPPTGSSRFFPNEASISSSHTASGHHNHHEESDNQSPCSLSIEGSDVAVSSSCSGIKTNDQVHANDSHDHLVDFETPRSGNLQFSFARQSMETVGVNDIRNYIKKFGKELRKVDVECGKVRSRYNADDYDANRSAESVLFDRVIYRNRIDSGGLLVCNIRIF